MLKRLLHVASSAVIALSAADRQFLRELARSDGGFEPAEASAGTRVSAAAAP